MERSLREQVAAYLLGELESAELAEFERRLADDPGLRDEVDRMGRVVQELRELPRESWEAEELPPLELPVAELSGPPARTAAARWRRWLTLGESPSPARFHSRCSPAGSSSGRSSATTPSRSRQSSRCHCAR